MAASGSDRAGPAPASAEPPAVRARSDEQDFATAAVERVHSLLGARVEALEWPAGRGHDSLRARLPGGSVIVTRRPSLRRAELECFVLRALKARQAPVPALLAAEGQWLIQEDLGGLRLSVALNGGDPRAGELALDAALGALSRIHEAGRAAGLEQQVVALGATRDWLLRLIDLPRRLGDHLGAAAPALETERLLRVLTPERPLLIKWDARPANAALADDGRSDDLAEDGDPEADGERMREPPRIGWYDWEHCGCRNPLDDMAWLLCDEFVPVWPEIESRLIERHLFAFAAGRPASEALIGLRSFGTLHMTQRLALIVDRKGEGPWWRWSRCLERDHIGVTAQAASRLCQRAALWAEEAPLLSGLAPWFRTLPERLLA